KSVTALSEFSFDPLDLEVGVLGKGVVDGGFWAFEIVVQAGAEIGPRGAPIDTEVETGKPGVRGEFEGLFDDDRLRLTLHSGLH
ncbi:MAG: hypothetical protein WA209_06070, partial [Candidatus Acidiferrales bacterium]